MFLIDLFVVNLSVFLSFMIRMDWRLDEFAVTPFLFFMFWASVIRIGLFVFFGLYQWSFRYASISEVLSVLKAVTIGSLLLIALAFFTRHAEIMGRSVLLIDYLICGFLIGAARFSPRIWIKLRRKRHQNLTRMLVVGAGAGGELVVRELIHARMRHYQPVGFVDDNPAKKNVRIHGVRVLGTTDDINSIVLNNSIEEIVIAIPSASGRTIRNIISKCEKTEVKIKIIPEFQKILTGEITVKQLRDVSPEDLLGRETVSIDTKDVSDFIQDKVVLVTGAGGTIGSELTKQIIQFNPKLLVLWDYNENDTYFLKLELEDKYPYIKTQILIGDVKDVGLLKYAFTKFRPQIVFHSAAHKHVPLMEDNPVSAVKNNILATRNLIYAAEHYGVESFVMISTDKAVNPTSVMGASKRIAEMVIQSKAKDSKTKFIAVRFGNVIGSSGSVVPIFKQQIERGGPLTVTHPDVKRFFMTASEAAQLVLQAGAIGKGGEIFILDMGEQMRILDLARNLVTLSGLDPDKDIEIRFTGLRAGEKLYEETLLDIEHDKATKHDKIYMTQAADFPRRELHKDIKDLERLANVMDEKGIIKKIKKLIPAYTPGKHTDPESY